MVDIGENITADLSHGQVSNGGTIGQVYTKLSSTYNDAGWADAASLADQILLSTSAVSQVLFQGLLADRPDGGDVPLNFTYYASDVGIIYCNLADGWHQAGADPILYSSMALGHLYVLELHAGATDTYPTG